MVDIQNLFSNILFVIFPHVIRDVFFPEQTKASKWVFASLSSLSIILCMTFPIIHFSGQVMDLRLLPFLFAFLYGGWPIGLLLLAIMFYYRFVLGGSGVYANVIAFLILLGALFPVRLYYHQVSLKLKVSLVVFFTLFHYSIIVGIHILLGVFTWSVHLWILLIQPTTTVFLTFLIEKHQEMQVIREQIHRTEKLQAVSDMAASVSHEVRNPLTVVRGFMQLMLNDAMNQQYRSYLKLSIDELDRAEKIISDYLAYARPQTEKSERIALEDELQHAVSILTPFAHLHQVEVILSIGQQGEVWGDRIKLRQALVNIMKNGIESMEKGGVLSVHLDQKHSFLCIRISDNGIGMTPSQIQRLGTPYYSLKEKGTGLGTMVSFRIIEWMQGKIEVQSQVGKGTTFFLYLPVAVEN